MAINYASKYEKKVAERFKLKSLTESAINKDYTWAGVNSINVYSVSTTALGDYVMTANGIARYGTPTDAANTIQTLTVSKDRAFSIINDKKFQDDTQGVMESGKILARQTDELIIPEIDAYRLAVMNTAAIAAGGETLVGGAVQASGVAITASNAYLSLLNGAEYFGNNKVPMNGRICFCTYAFYNFLKLDPSFMLASEIAMNERINGMVGMVDGIKIVPVPSSYLPTSVAFILCHPAATVGADKLEDYKIHDNPPGISGALIEGRVRYDSFVLTAKSKGVYTHLIA
jgi:N4-gp56 family major capsid protein